MVTSRRLLSRLTHTERDRPKGARGRGVCQRKTRNASQGPLSARRQRPALATTGAGCPRRPFTRDLRAGGAPAGRARRAVLPAEARVSVHTEPCSTRADRKRPQDGGALPTHPSTSICVYVACVQIFRWAVGPWTLGLLCLIFLLCKNGCDVSTYLVRHCGDRMKACL